MKIYDKIENLIGNTPLFEPKKLAQKLGLSAKILLKLESFNPAGSVKDRAALFMLNDAENKGLIKKGGTVIEPTSGNTGIGLASICASRGYKLILTMPESMSEERRNILKAYGAEIVLTDAKSGMQGCVEKARELSRQIPNSFIPSQFDNGANPLSHYQTTGPEIYIDTEGKVDIFIAGVGSGGTVSGVGKFLKEKNSKIEIVAVEPQSSPLISKGVSGAHKIQGIGANFIPKNFDKSVVDKIITVTDSQAMEFARLLAVEEGVLVGISSGAALAVAIDVAKREENKEKIIVVLMPDTGERYLSTELYK